MMKWNCKMCCSTETHKAGNFYFKKSKTYLGEQGLRPPLLSDSFCKFPQSLLANVETVQQIRCS
jgi:hypothetical protein